MDGVAKSEKEWDEEAAWKEAQDHGPARTNWVGMDLEKLIEWAGYEGPAGFELQARIARGEIEITETRR